MARHKYRAKPVVIDGIKFASTKEGDRYLDLKMLRSADVIRDIELQPEFLIEIEGVKIKYRSGRQVRYVADFRYFDIEKGYSVVEDVKGYRTPVYKLKLALMSAMGIEVTEI